MESLHVLAEGGEDLNSRLQTESINSRLRHRNRSHGDLSEGYRSEGSEYDDCDTVYVTKLTAAAISPTRATDGAVGYDLFSTQRMLIQPQGRSLIPTGIVLQIPVGFYGRIASRSGLAFQHGIQVGAGVIDPDYRGEIKVL